MLNASSDGLADTPTEIIPVGGEVQSIKMTM